MKLPFLLFIFQVLHVTSQPQTVFDLVASNSQLATFNLLLAAVPQVRRGIGSSLFTVFAPTDAAFLKLKETNPEEYAMIFNDTSFAYNLLQYHMVKNISLADSKNLPERSFLTTVSGSDIRMDAIPQSDILIGNGFVMGNVTYSFGALDGTLSLVDTVLLTPPTTSSVFSEIMQLAPNYNWTDYINAVDDLNRVTVFLPSITAFQDLFQVLDGISSLSVLTSILNLHILTNTYSSIDLKLSQLSINLPTCLINSSITLVNNGFGLIVSGPGNKASGNVIASDYIIDSGIMHTVDITFLPFDDVISKAAISNLTIYPYKPF